MTPLDCLRREEADFDTPGIDPTRRSRLGRGGGREEEKDALAGKEVREVEEAGLGSVKSLLIGGRDDDSVEDWVM